MKNAFNLDEKTKEQIKEYFKGIKIKPENNYLKYAINLDQKIGRKQMAEGNLKEAYKTYQQVLAISYNNESLRGIGIALGQIGRLLNKADDRDNALRTYMLQYKITKLMHTKPELGIVELSISRLMSYDNINMSTMWLLRAKENLKDTHYKRDTVYVLADLAGNYYYYRQFEKSVELYKEAWDLSLTTGNSRDNRWARWEAGKLYSIFLQRTDKYSDSLKILDSMLKEFPVDEKQGTKYIENSYLLAKSYSNSNNSELADKHYQNAYLTYQTARAKSLGDAGRVKLDTKFSDLVDDYINHLLSNNKYLEALVIIESNKAQTLNDIMDDVYQKDVYKKLSDLNTKHQTEIKSLFDNDPDNIDALDDEYIKKFMDLAKNQQKERQALEISLNIRNIPVSKSLSADDIANIQNQLPKDTAILAYFISYDSSGLFILERDKKQFIKLNNNSATYYKLAKQLRASIINTHTDFYLESSKKLYNELLDKAEKQISPSIKNLIISSDGTLSNIPFSPLYDGKSFLIEKYSIFRIPSLRFIKNVASAWNKTLNGGIACVDPQVTGARLPFQAETGDYMKKLYSSKLDLISAKDCSVTTLSEKINSIKTPSFLHIGAHGNFYSGKPMESSIYLSNSDDSKSGIWTAQDIATADLSNIPLVTLSSCETGLSNISKRRDVFGFHRALFFAGTKSVVSPLWAVHDKGTAFLMQNFYKSYSSGNNAVNSLKKAQLSSIKNKEYSHPFYWSGYTMTGLLL